MDNIQKDEDYQYLIIKKESEEDFVKFVGLKNEMEFYFIYSLINNLIKRIGNIVRQNDNDFNIIFNNISTDLDDLIQLKLVKSDEENKFKYIISCPKEITSLKDKRYILKDFEDFATNFIDRNIEALKKILGEKKIEEITKNIKIKNDTFTKINEIQEKIINISNIQDENISFVNDNKNLFIIFPKIKKYLEDLISGNYDKSDIKNLLKENGDEEIKAILNSYIDNYLFANSMCKKLEEINIFYEENYKEYQNLLKKNLDYEFITIILGAFKEKCNEINLVDIFEQEKNKLIQLFKKSIENKIKNLNEKTEIKDFNKKDEFIKLMSAEVKKMETAVEKMKNIDIDFINNKFKKFLDNIDIHSYAYSKFDVILYLYQNNYI